MLNLSSKSQSKINSQDLVNSKSNQHIEIYHKKIIKKKLVGRSLLQVYLLIFSLIFKKYIHKFI